MEQVERGIKAGDNENKECPKCNSKKIWKDGIRETEFGSVQRFLCRDCGVRFSDKSNIELAQSSHHQLCANTKAKKLDTQAETRIVCAGEKSLQKLPKEARGLVIEYMPYLAS